MNESRVRSTGAAARVSRRRFLKLTAAGAAAALAVPAATIARAATAAKSSAPAKSAASAKPAAPGSRGHVASAKEIEKLKGYLDGSLKAVRGFELPPGSDMAFSFRAMKPRRAKQGL